MLVDPCENVTGASQVAQNIFLSVSGNALRNKQFKTIASNHVPVLRSLWEIISNKRYEKIFKTLYSSCKDVIGKQFQQSVIEMLFITFYSSCKSVVRNIFNITLIQWLIFFIILIT